MFCVFDELIALLDGDSVHNLRIELDSACVRVYLISDAKGIDADELIIPIVYSVADGVGFVPLYELSWDAENDKDCIYAEEFVLILEIFKFMHRNCEILTELCSKLKGCNR